MKLEENDRGSKSEGIQHEGRKAGGSAKMSVVDREGQNLLVQWGYGNHLNVV